jgi:hypothetical protein
MTTAFDHLPDTDKPHAPRFGAEPVRVGQIYFGDVARRWVRFTSALTVRTRTTLEEAAHGLNTVTEAATVEGPWVVEERLEYLRTRP